MMTIIATPNGPGGFVVETSDLINRKIQREEVANEGQAVRLAHSWNRQYVIEKMTGWILQSVVVFQMADHKDQLRNANILLDLIADCNRISVQEVYRVICDSESLIHSIAPPVSSKRYDYFERMILEIIKHCKKERGLIK